MGAAARSMLMHIAAYAAYKEPTSRRRFYRIRLSALLCSALLCGGAARRSAAHGEPLSLVRDYGGVGVVVGGGIRAERAGACLSLPSAHSWVALMRVIAEVRQGARGAEDEAEAQGAAAMVH
jgi:hypothetical protein